MDVRDRNLNTELVEKALIPFNNALQRQASQVLEYIKGEEGKQIFTKYFMGQGHRNTDNKNEDKVKNKSKSKVKKKSEINNKNIVLNNVPEGIIDSKKLYGISEKMVTNWSGKGLSMRFRDFEKSFQFISKICPEALDNYIPYGDEGNFSKPFFQIHNPEPRVGNNEFHIILTTKGSSNGGRAENVHLFFSIGDLKSFENYFNKNHDKLGYVVAEDDRLIFI